MQKINVLGVEIDQGPAKELKTKAISFLYSDAVNTVDIVRTKALVEAGNREDLRETLEHMDLTVIDEKPILDAAGITDSRRIQEVENQTFLKEFLRYVDKRRMRVFLMTDTEEHLKDMEDFFGAHYGGMHMEGAFSLDRCPDDEDMAVNEINGSAADVVICALSSPLKEEFAMAHKTKLNVRLLLLVGYIPSRNKKSVWKPSLFSRMIGSSIFKKRLSEYQKKEEEDKR